MRTRIAIKPEPSFDRIRKTLLLKDKPDRLPLCDFSVALGLKEWVLGGAVEKVDYFSDGKSHTMLSAKDEVDFWIAAGYDFVCAWPFYNFALSDVRDKAGSASAEGVGIIRTLDDLHSNQWPWQDPDRISMENVLRIAEVLPEEMKIIILAHDIFTYTWENMGFTHFCTSLFECPQLVEELMSQIGETVCTITERVVEAAGDKIGSIWYADDLAFNTGTFVDPDVYRMYLFPYVKRLAVLCGQLNAPFIYHTDGRLWTLFDDFQFLGVHAIHPLEPKSMEAVEVKEKQGHRFCLIGNIDLDLLSRGTPEEIERSVQDRIEKLGYNGGYCVGSSNTLPDYVNPENYKAMIETTFKYGKLR
jgi:uroporphyrinogen decarboxylase